MLWLDQPDSVFGESTVLVLFRDDMTFARFADTWRADEPEPPALAPPAERFAPTGRLGKVWREGAGVRARLGWALEPEKRGGPWATEPQLALNGALQPFERGAMYWVPYQAGTAQYQEDRWIYVLRTSAPQAGQSGNTWMEFPDTWRG